MKKQIFLSVSDLSRLDEHDDVWALNNTKGEYRGNVFFTVPSLNNGLREDQVLVSCTFAPVNLTEQVTRKQLLDSSSFRRAVASQTLHIISAADAQELLKDTAIRAEYDRVVQERVGSHTLESTTALGREEPQKDVSELNGVGAHVIQFVALLETATDTEAVVSCRNLGELSKEEWQHIHTGATNNGFVSLAELAAQNI